LLIIARAVSNLFRLLSPNEWLFPYAAPPPRSHGGRMDVNYAIPGTCIQTHLPRPARREATFIATFGDRFFSAAVPGASRPEPMAYNATAMRSGLSSVAFAMLMLLSEHRRYSCGLVI
jgi:hypothetical protein